MIINIVAKENMEPHLKFLSECVPKSEVASVLHFQLMFNLLQCITNEELYKKHL